MNSVWGHQAWGVPYDVAEAMKWYRAAADQDYPYGQFWLGAMYTDGLEIGRDYFEAVRWFRKAANRGHAYAQYRLGDMYYKGHGVPKDFSEAAKWYRLAADQNEVQAQNALGHMYAEGIGVPNDLVQSFLWLRLAAGTTWRIPSREKSFFYNVTKQMNSAELAEAQKLYKAWRPVISEYPFREYP